MDSWAGLTTDINVDTNGINNVLGYFDFDIHNLSALVNTFNQTRKSYSIEFKVSFSIVSQIITRDT